MEEDDQELENELEMEQMEIDDKDLDEEEFLKHGDELDLPEEEEEADDVISLDARGEETDSELEEYYKELGIENEEDFA